jgi:hypothetical protein
MFRTHRYLPALILSAGVLGVAPACASYGYYGYQRGGVYRDVERRAYDIGYREGSQAGEEDGRKGRVFSFERHGTWRDADDGYHHDYGDREFYRRAFRQGYEAGYTQAFNRYRGYGYGAPRGAYPYPYPSAGTPYPYPAGAPAYSSPAAQIGFRDGYEVGRNDARDRESFDPVRSSRYRSADHEYDHRYGPKEEYKRIYRDAFQRGYDQGYREYRRY